MMLAADHLVEGPVDGSHHRFVTFAELLMPTLKMRIAYPTTLSFTSVEPDQHAW